MVLLPWIIHSGNEVSIPSVVGKPFDAASALLEQEGLKPVIGGKTPSDKIPAGYVVIQNPPAASVVREGRNVYLTISGGEEEIQMPNLRGRSLRDAKFTLERYDLVTGTITYQPSDLPEEIILAQEFPPGQRVRKTTAVGLTVSQGPLALQISVPYLVGLYLEEAQNRLAESGLRLGQVGYVKSQELLPNTIISQSPRAGDMVDQNTPIDVTIVH